MPPSQTMERETARMPQISSHLTAADRQAGSATLSSLFFPAGAPSGLQVDQFIYPPSECNILSIDRHCTESNFGCKWLKDYFNGSLPGNWMPSELLWMPFSREIYIICWNNLRSNSGNLCILPFKVVSMVSSGPKLLLFQFRKIPPRLLFAGPP